MRTTSLEEEVKVMEDLMEDVAKDVKSEAALAWANHGGCNSQHEAYAVLLEEVEEYWEDVRKRSKLRNKGVIRDELKQIAAVAMCAIYAMDRGKL